MTQEQSDAMYMEICQVIAKQSKAVRAKVGAVIVKNGNILSMGMNGTPAGFDNYCEYAVCEHCTEHQQKYCKNTAQDVANCKHATLHTKPEVLHAESNAFMKLAKHGSSHGCDGATMYCTYSPCYDCAKMIVQSGIKRLVYLEEYRITDGLELLRKAGIEVEQIKLK